MEYQVTFDERSISWCGGTNRLTASADLNRIFLEAQQNYANHLLRARGHLFLNEVLDALGMDRTGAGQLHGWHGDTYVDFHIPKNHDFNNGVPLKFVCQEDVYKRLDDD